LMRLDEVDRVDVEPVPAFAAFARHSDDDGHFPSSHSRAEACQLVVAEAR
jgi:hypothetical protein